MNVSSAKQQAQDLERQGKVREALAMYRHVLTSLEGTPELLRELPLYVKAGDLFLKLDNPRAAVSLYETAGKIYAAHGSAKSVNAICAKVVRVMPERTHVYTRLLRIMLEHGHVVAARHVLASYAEHAGLLETRERLDLLADRTDEHVRPVLEMLIEMAERLELPHAAAGAAEASRPADLAAPPEEAPPAPSAPPPPIDAPIGYGVPEEPEEQEPADREEEEPAHVPEEAAEADARRDSLGLGLLRADAVPVAAEPEADAPRDVATESVWEEPGAAAEAPVAGEQDVEAGIASAEEDAADAEAVVIEHSGMPDEEVPEDEAVAEEVGGETEEPGEVAEREPVGGPFGLGLVTADLASEVESRLAPPHLAFDEAQAESTVASPEVPEGHAAVEDAAQEPYAAAAAKPDAETPDAPPAAGEVPRTRVRGDGTDWDLDPGLPGRAGRRRSPVGSVLLEVAEREHHRRPRYVWMAIAAGALVIIAGGTWAVRALRGPAETAEPGMIADSVPLDSAASAAMQASPPPQATAENAPLTLHPNPALAVDSLALPPISDSLSPTETAPGVGMPPSEGGVTVVAVSGLPIERVSEVTVDGRQGYEARQTLETGERLLVFSIPAQPEDTVGLGEVIIAPGAGGVLAARLRVGTHDVEVRGNVTEAAMRALVLRLAETSTTPE